MQKHLISIIIPIYNRAHLISETLDSILLQAHKNWECILVDDGSDDKSIDVIKSYTKLDKRFSLYQRPKDKPKGGNAARNFGFTKAKGEYVQFFDSDDIMLPKFLELKYDKFNETLDFVVCTGATVDFELNNKVKINLTFKESETLFSQYIKWDLKIFTPSVLFRKKFLDKNNLFSEIILRGQETELFSRLFYGISENQYKIINKSLFLYRQHPTNKTSINKGYVKTFKESQTIINVDNFKRAVLAKDQDLAQYLYRQLITLFLAGLENEHLSNSKFILKKLGKELLKTDKAAALKFYSLCYFYLYIYRVYRFRKKIKSVRFRL